MYITYNACMLVLYPLLFLSRGGRMQVLSSTLKMDQAEALSANT